MASFPTRTAGGEYASARFRRACRRLDVFPSIGRVGPYFDNGVSEAFKSVLKVEFVHRHTFTSRTESRTRITTWIIDFCSGRRLHSVCGFKSPIDLKDVVATLPTTLAPLASTGAQARTAACTSSGQCGCSFHERQRCR